MPSAAGSCGDGEARSLRADAWWGWGRASAQVVLTALRPAAGRPEFDARRVARGMAIWFSFGLGDVAWGNSRWCASITVVVTCDVTSLEGGKK